MKKTILFLSFILFLAPKNTQAQIDESQLGGWYMYFYSADFGESRWGIQGDVQYRNWNLAGDLEQLLLRSGITYRPENTNLKLTLGYGNITTGAFGSDSSTVNESRIYQEALFPTKVAERILLTHRLRFEQRFNPNQDLRTRYRYNLFVTVPINNPSLVDNTWYISIYDELFINGQRDIGQGNTVEIFDRNRLYGAVGFKCNSHLKFQLGTMLQTTNSWEKLQTQLSLHHTF